MTKRYHDAMVSGASPLSPERWKEWLNKAKASVEEARVDVAEYILEKRPMNKLPAKSYVVLHPGWIAVPAQVLLDVEATMAQMEIMSTEIDELMRDLKDEAHRMRMMDRLEEAKRRIAERLKPRLSLV